MSSVQHCFAGRITDLDDNEFRTYPFFSLLSLFACSEWTTPELYVAGASCLTRPSVGHGMVDYPIPNVGSYAHLSYAPNEKDFRA